ncbi:MAG: DciA family protein, partial [Actinomycetota bacterium]
MRDPVGIQSLVGRVAGELGLAEVLAAGRLFRSWEEIVGREVAARSQPLSLRGGVLRIQSDSAAWASEVRYLAPEILRRTNE